MPDCSVIISVRDQVSLAIQCIEGLWATLPRTVDTEVILVVHGADDALDSVLALYGARLRVVRLEHDHGFAAACNEGAAQATGETLVFLHHEMLPLHGWLGALLRAAQAHPDAAVIGSKLLYPNNTVQHAGIVIASDHTPQFLYVGFSPEHPAVNTSRSFRAVSAAGALVRRQPFIDVAGFDTTMADAFADSDLCLRLGDLGHSVRYCHESVLFHMHRVPAAGSPDTPSRDAHDRQVFHRRWGHRLTQDDVRYYAEDGLLRVTYDAKIGAQCVVSPLLADTSPESDTIEMKQLLNRRARQVFDLMQENVTLAAAMEGRDLQTLSVARLRAFLASGRRLTFPDTEKPLVSVVIPTYNRADQTYAALESLLAHGEEIPFEVVIVDNQSRDETGRLLDQLDNVQIHRNTDNRGFGDACNRGAEMARGAYVCFLNSDTLVTPGWLRALLDEIENDPRCGAVGAKLILPNGRLQEAGSIIWRDGSALGYGRGAEPFDPAFGYAREVDYCSAACLLVRRDLFHRLGGYDPRYGLGYYEDTDLCMSIWQAGYTVRYAPRAIIFHLEHASSDRSSAAKRMEQNRDIFMERWADALETHGLLKPLDILRGRDRRPGPRLLMLDDVVPMPRFGSGFQRAYALIETLIELGYVISFLPLTNPTPFEPRTTELQQRSVEVLHSLTDIPAKLQEYAGLFDIAMVSRPHNAAMIDLVRRYNPDATIIYDAEAVFSLREAKQAYIEGRPQTARDIDANVRAELAPVGSVDLALTVSEGERRALHRFHPQIPVMVWGDSLPIRVGSTTLDDRRDLLFIGYLGSPPNNDAVLRLLQEIFPEVQKRVQCNLLIAGIDASAEAKAAAATFGSRVQMPGYVEDLRELYDTYRVFVAPHRFAAGVARKVIEAMSQGIPCVISELLAEQLQIEDGTVALVGTDAADFGAKIARLYEDAALWRQIRENALTLVHERYDPERMKALLKRSIDGVMAHKQAGVLLRGR